MADKLVECVANFSEGRRMQVIDDIKEAISSLPDVVLLDQHSDADHNRTVLTFAGAPEEIEEAAYRAIARAAELINLDEHRGEHPRIGAADVVPFVPISGVSMQDCVEIARRLGERVGDELGIPVYLYEEAAARPDRTNLEDIRRGEYEGLKVEIRENPERKPDFGPVELGPAGAVVIGARPFLIAYNVNLTTGDISIAKKVARAVRHSSGGMRYVKALGMLVEGRAQVSMNLTNFKRTPLARVVESIRREASRYGVSIHSSELVGLIPQEALVDAAQWYLQLDGLKREQVLEYRLQEARRQAEGTGDVGVTVESGFLDALASGEPTPGGGSAAAYSAAAGAALAAMAAKLTIGKKGYEQVESQMVSNLEKAEELRWSLAEDVTRDAESFNEVMDAYRMPKETPEQRTLRSAAIQETSLRAAQIPLEVARKALQVMELAGSAVSQGNVNTISDSASGAALAKASLTSAGYNVQINTQILKDREIARQLVFELKELQLQADILDKQIQSALESRGGFSLA